MYVRLLCVIVTCSIHPPMMCVHHLYVSHRSFYLNICCLFNLISASSLLRCKVLLEMYLPLHVLAFSIAPYHLSTEYAQRKTKNSHFMFITCFVFQALQVVFVSSGTVVKRQTKMHFIAGNGSNLVAECPDSNLSILMEKSIHPRKKEHRTVFFWFKSSCSKNYMSRCLPL